MHASGIVLPDLRMTTMTTAAEQFTAAEQLSELVATRRANMSTAMLRMASVSRAVGTKLYVNDRIMQIMNIPCIFGIITLIMYIMRLNPGWFPEPTRV